jgi:predicted restriction endonuclease
MLDISGMIQISERELARLQTFDPESGKAGRNQVIESIIRRRGHPSFRQQLLAAYGYRCAITSCNALDALEAAYIIPYRGRFTHHPSNGLLLRCDLHTLFDLGKLTIDTRNMTVVLADDLLESSYRILAGRPLRFPAEAGQRPSIEALDLHRRLAGL